MASFSSGASSSDCGERCLTRVRSAKSVMRVVLPRMAPSTAKPAEFERGKPHVAAERIVHAQHVQKPFGEPLDHRDLEPEPDAPDLGGKAGAARKKGGDPPAHLVDRLTKTIAQGRAGQVVEHGTMPAEGLERQVDAVEVAESAAVLQMIDDLQCRAQGIRRWPCRAGFAEHVEDEAADGHGGVAAVADESSQLR